MNQTPNPVQLQRLTQRLASTENRLRQIVVRYDVACQGYRVQFNFDARSVAVLIPEIDLYRVSIEEAIENALHDTVGDLDQLDVIDVEFRVERKGLPGPAAL
jgi:hypothetical protein